MTPEKSAELLNELREAMSGLTEEAVWYDRRFNSIQYQQTIGPMSMNLIFDICARGIGVEKALNSNQYNDYDVMSSILDRTLRAWEKSNKGEME